MRKSPAWCKRKRLDKTWSAQVPHKWVYRSLQVKGSILDQIEPHLVAYVQILSKGWLMSNRQVNRPHTPSNYMCASNVHSKEDVPAILKLTSHEQMTHYVNLMGFLNSNADSRPHLLRQRNDSGSAPGRFLCYRTTQIGTVWPRGRLPMPRGRCPTIQIVLECASCRELHGSDTQQL